MGARVLLLIIVFPQLLIHVVTLVYVNILRKEIPMDKTVLENNFKTRNVTADSLNTIAEINAKAKEFALLINELCPESREKSIAFTELETAKLWAAESILRNS